MPWFGWLVRALELGFCVAVAIGVSLLVQAGTMVFAAAAVACLAVLGALAAAGWSLPGQLLLWFIFVACLEGPLKNIAPNPAVKLGVYVLRDVILYGGLWLAYRRGIKLWPGTLPLRGLIVGYLALLFLQLFNPSGFGPLISLLASRTYWEMVPLYFIGLAYMTRTERWVPLARVGLACGMLNAIAAIIEYLKGPSWMASLGPGYRYMMTSPEARTYLDALGRLQVRPPGLGSDMGFAGSMAFFLWPILLGALFHPKLRAAWPVPLSVLAFVTLLVGTLISQSRSLLLLSPFMLGAFLLLLARWHFKRVLLTGALTAVIVGVGLNLASGQFPDILSRYRSVMGIASTANTFVNRETRSTTAFSTPVSYLGQYFWGNGMGKVGPGGGVFVKDGSYEATNAENMLLLMITETGGITTLVLLGLHLAFLRHGLAALRRAEDPDTRILIAIPLSTLLIMLVLWPLGNFATFPGSAAFWFYGGTLVAFNKPMADPETNAS